MPRNCLPATVAQANLVCPDVYFSIQRKEAP